MNLKQGQTLSVDFKTPDTLSKSGGWLSGGASIYDANGPVQAVDWLVNSRGQMESLQWTAPTSGWIYFSVGNAAGAGWANHPGIVYVIWIQYGTPKKTASKTASNVVFAIRVCYSTSALAENGRSCTAGK